MGMLRGYEIKATAGLRLSISRKRAKNAIKNVQENRRLPAAKHSGQLVKYLRMNNISPR
jgi:hypothetical protein